MSYFLHPRFFSLLLLGSFQFVQIFLGVLSTELQVFFQPYHHPAEHSDYIMHLAG